MRLQGALELSRAGLYSSDSRVYGLGFRDSSSRVCSACMAGQPAELIPLYQQLVFLAFPTQPRWKKKEGIPVVTD